MCQHAIAPCSTTAHAQPGGPRGDAAGHGPGGQALSLGRQQPPGEGFDCSGLVQHVYREALGIELPRTSRQMGQRGSWIALKDLAPGDLVFFQTGRHPNSHVGVYIGNHRFVHAPSSGSLVRVESINRRYWLTRFNGGRRPMKTARM